MSSIVQHAPHFSGQDAERLARDIYGIDVDAKLLPSERDQNFRLRAKSGESYVLKLANAAERIEVLDFQNQAMMHIARKKDQVGQNKAICPQVCATRDGEFIATANGAGGSTRHEEVVPEPGSKPTTPGSVGPLGRTDEAQGTG